MFEDGKCSRYSYKREERYPVTMRIVVVCGLIDRCYTLLIVSSCETVVL